MTKRLTAFSLGAVIVCALSVAAVWAVRVPLFEAPDELAHADYAFALYDAGRPFHIERPRLQTVASKQASFLSRAVGYRAMRYNPYARVPAGYGTVAYFRNIDALAPARSERSPAPGAGLPYVAAVYPAGYYTLEAVLMLAASALAHGSLFAAFFAARFTNVALLGVTLFAANVMFRRSGLGPRTSVVAVAALGFFPLESSIAGYIQPDNLVAALYCVTLAATLPPRYRSGVGAPAPYAWFVAIGLLVAATVLTKVHYAAALALVTLPAAALRIRRATWLRDAMAMLASCVALPALAYHYSSTVLNPVGHLISPKTWAGMIGDANASVATSVATLERMGPAAFADVFFGGNAFQDFWIRFGIRSGTVFPGPLAATVGDFLLALTVIALALFFFVEMKLAVRLAAVAGRRSVSTALRLVVAATPVNAYCTVSAMMIGIGALTNGGLVLQGRYWLPVTASLGVVLFVHLPKILRAGPRRRARSALVTCAAAYSIIASAFGVAALQTNFYDAPRRGPTSDTIADIDRVSTPGKTRENVDSITMRHDESLRVSGYAIDMMTGLPPESVILSIDGRDRRARSDFFADPTLVRIFNDDALLRSRFNITLNRSSIGPGTHTLRCYVVDRKATYRLAIRRAIELRVL